MKKKNKVFFYRGTFFDYPALFLILFLVFFGLIMIMSVSAYQGRLDAEGDSLYYFKRQLIFAVIGIAAMWIVSGIKYQLWKNFSLIIYVIAFILCGLVLFAGSASRGSSRWLNLGFISFQPSEIAKFALIIYMAYICTAKSKSLNSVGRTILVMLPPGALMGVIAIENLSTAIVCGVIAFGIWFVATPKPIYAVVLIILAVGFVIYFLNGAGYRGNRVEAWRNLETSEYAYQTRQAMYAIGSGGLFGRGLGQSIQKSGNLPEAHNDMIFSIICEELGIVGGIALIVVFLMLLWRLRFIAEGAPDRFGALLVTGVIIHLGVHLVLNICVVTNTLPNTGCTLPFFSYGGTSLALLLVEMGIVLAVSRQIVPMGAEEVAG